MIGRREEIAVLEECLNSSRPEFLAIYGRRRVGKTYLVKEYFNNTFSFYSTGVYGSNTRQQLRAFKEALVEYGDDEKSIPKDWFEAFSRLRVILEKGDVTREYKTGKRIVFLDELPWMDTARSDFKSALDYFWNSWGSSQKDLLLIVCGSATSWIINHLVKDTGGFYNRLTKHMRLMPFDLSECEQLLQANGVELSRRQIVECYMIFGGIPYYLNYLKPGLSLAQNVEMLFFKENAPLRYEFRQLFASLFRNADQYIAIIRELSSKKTGMTRKDLIKTGKVIEGKGLTKCLTDLEQCGFIRKYQNFASPKNGAYYQLIDSMSLFYLTIIEPEKVDSWINFISTPAYYAWCGISFERVCFMHMDQIKKCLGISGITSHDYSWRSSRSTPGVQVDMLIDRNDDVINVCEIKFSQDMYEIDASYEKELIHRMDAIRKETGTKKALWLTMITFAGVRKNAYSGSVVSELTGEDLFD
ncbi:MAG: ATP-binding protein [Lachnospiraceae bacterium]|nr:ATP-binding protein [Lachnospiraceae bacterium]